MDISDIIFCVWSWYIFVISSSRSFSNNTTLESGKKRQSHTLLHITSIINQLHHSRSLQNQYKYISVLIFHQWGWWVAIYKRRYFPPNSGTFLLIITQTECAISQWLIEDKDVTSSSSSSLYFAFLSLNHSYCQITLNLSPVGRTILSRLTQQNRIFEKKK